MPRSRIAACSDSSVRLASTSMPVARLRSSPPASRAATAARSLLGADGRADGVHQPLGPVGHDLPVGVRLVPLEHRELGVVLGREALVAEVLADLVDPLQPAHDQPLEVQLGRDPQVHRAVERVVVRRERPRQRAAVDRLQDRRLDLDEALVVEEAADRGDDLARVMKSSRVSSLAIRSSSRWRKRVSVSVRPWCFSGGGRRDLASSVPVVDLDRQLAAAGLEDRAVGADQVAEVERERARSSASSPSTSRPRLQLDAPGAVDQVEERHLALAAARGQAAGDAHPLVRLLAGFESCVRRLDVGDRRHARVGVRERVDPRLPQCLELAAAGGEQLESLARLHVTPLRSW